MTDTGQSPAGYARCGVVDAQPLVLAAQLPLVYPAVGQGRCQASACPEGPTAGTEPQVTGSSCLAAAPWSEQLLAGNSRGKTPLSFLNFALQQLGVKLQLKPLQMELLRDEIIKSFINQ